MKNLISKKPNKECKLYQDVYINGKCVGTVMADNTMSAYDCYQSLKNNWKIDKLEMQENIKNY